MEALNNLESVLLDPDGNPSISGSPADLLIIKNSLGDLRTALAKEEQERVNQDRNIAATVVENQELRARILTLVDENKSLQAKLTALENQKPIGDGYTMLVTTGDTPSTINTQRITVVGYPVYAAEGAAPVPEGWQPMRRTPEMHSAVRRVLKYHGLTKVGDGVVEADLIEAMLAATTRSAS